MASINKVILLGNVGNVEVKEFGDDGKFIVQISLATSYGYKKKDGEFENVTEWHKCIFAIPSLAERAKGIKIGDVINVEGSIRTNKWTDKESGEERSNKEISVTFYSTHKRAAKSEDGGESDSSPSSSGSDLPF